MISHGIGILPLIHEIMDTHPQVTHPWYANDAGLGVNFSTLLAQLWGLIVCALPVGILPRSNQDQLGNIGEEHPVGRNLIHRGWD